jgi:hypothetical protein
MLRLTHLNDDGLGLLKFVLQNDLSVKRMLPLYKTPTDYIVPFALCAGGPQLLTIPVRVRLSSCPQILQCPRTIEI